MTDNKQNISCQEIACLENKICVLSNIVNILLSQPPPLSQSLCFSEFHLPIPCGIPDDVNVVISSILDSVTINACDIFPIQATTTQGSPPTNVDFVASQCNPVGSFGLTCLGTGRPVFVVPPACGGCYQVTMSVSVLTTINPIVNTTFDYDLILVSYTSCVSAPSLIASSTVSGTKSISSQTQAPGGITPAEYDGLISTGIVCLQPGQLIGPAIRFKTVPDIGDFILTASSFSILFRQLSSVTCT